MAQPIAPDYGQQFLFPPALEDWVAQDHPARFLREFVDQLDLPALGFAVPVAVEGRPPYHPSLLLKIWLYGYFHRIRSTRKLEAACAEHLPLLWLSGLIAPDHNSLWRFWRDNKKALRSIFKQTVQLAVNTGAVGFALQALDGTKIQAACSGPKGWSKQYMEKLLSQLEAALDDIELKVVEENPQTETPGYRLPAGLAERQALRQEIQKGLAQLGAASQAVTVADTGYGSGTDLQAASDKGLKVLAPSPGGKPGKDHPYATQHFTIDPVAHTVICPQSRPLDYEGQTNKRGQIVERFRCHHRDCPVRAQCTRDPKGRQIEVWRSHPAVESMRQQLEQPAPREQSEQRSRIIEPRFAQLKQHDGFRRWTVWGLEGVRTQWSLLCATLNLRVLYKGWQSKLKTGLQQAIVALRRFHDEFGTARSRCLPAPLTPHSGIVAR